MKSVLLSLALIVAFKLGTINTVRAQGFSFGDPLGITKARNNMVLLQIDAAANALQAYNAMHNGFPPCLAEADPQVRKQRFMEHVAKAFANSSYGKTAESFDALNRDVREKWQYNFAKADGALAPLDLETLDPAEALVFWLGGFPVPLDPSTKQPIADAQTFRFHRDSDNPFKRDSADVEKAEPLRFRSTPMIDFGKRLVDNDGDGWKEYATEEPRGQPTPPLVYFDEAAYRATTAAAQLGTCSYPRDAKLAAAWGTVSPYAQTFDPADVSKTSWQARHPFQLIAAGADGKYGPPGAGVKLPAARLTVVTTFETFTADDDFKQPRDADPAEADNLTNFGYKPLAELKGEAK
jgi:hypothetical protein